MHQIINRAAYICCFLSLLLWSKTLNGQSISYNIKNKPCNEELHVEFNSGKDAGIFITDYSNIKPSIYKVFQNDSVLLYDFIYSSSGKFDSLTKNHNNWPSYKGLAVSQFEKIQFKMRFHLKKENSYQKVYFVFRVFDMCKNEGTVYFIPMTKNAGLQVQKLENFSHVLTSKVIN